MRKHQKPMQGRRRWAVVRNGQILGLILLAVWISGCEVMSPRYDPEQEPERAPTVAADYVARAPTLQEIINRLETGQLAQAEADLLSYLDARPGNRLALRFLEQLQSDPIELMGEDHSVVTVRPGESLSVIAARELGDGMQFFALARYNEIAVPRRVSPGAELRIPQSLKAEPVLPVEEAVVEPVQQPGEGLARTGQQLVASGRYQQAISLLSAAARGASLDASGQSVLAAAAVGRARELAEQDEHESGLELLDRVSGWLDEPAMAELEPGRTRLQAQARYRQAMSDRRAGRGEAALAALEEAVELEPGFVSAREQADQLRGLLVMQYHEQALVHYRDQELAEAIALWERVLELDEDFEPAQVYLPRARALQSRLRELDS